MNIEKNLGNNLERVSWRDGAGGKRRNSANDL